MWNPVKELKGFKTIASGSKAEVESGEGIERLNAFSLSMLAPSVESGEGIESIEMTPAKSSSAREWNPVKELKA